MTVEPAKSKRGKGRSAWVKGIVSVALFGLIFLVIPWGELRESAARLSFGVWSVVLIGYLAGHRLGAEKWRTLVNAGGARLDRRDSIRCHAAGLFANICLPSVVGGDVLRAALATRATGRTEATFFGSAADRAVDLIVTGFLIVFGAIVANRYYPGWTGRALAAATLSCVLIAGAFGPALLRRPIDRWPRRLRRPVGRSLVVLRRIRRTPVAVLKAASASMVMQVSFILLNAWIGRHVGVSAPLAVWFLVWPLAKVAGLMPISLGGLAVRDATLAGLLAPAGVPLASGIVAGFAWQSIMISGGLIGGVIWWRLSDGPLDWRLTTRAAVRS
jgi:glycosyltransferase 2 family protein